MESSPANRHAHEVVVLNQVLPACWKGVIVLQDLSLRFSQPGWKDFFVQSWQQQSNNLLELEKIIWELGGKTHPESYEKEGPPADPEEEPKDPLSLNRILLLRSTNHLSHLMHVYSEVRKISLPFDVRMVLQRHQLQIRETREHMMFIYLGSPLRRHRTLTDAAVGFAATLENKTCIPS